jgi:hypothetical protein
MPSAAPRGAGYAEAVLAAEENLPKQLIRRADHTKHLWAAPTFLIKWVAIPV